MEAMIIYLHGFRSGPQSLKVQALAARMAERELSGQFLCGQLPSIPAEAVALVEQQIHSCPTPPTLVGSSLGGFYATVLAEKFNLRAVVINPFVPHRDFDPSLFLGEHTMIYTPQRFVFGPEHVKQIQAMDLPALQHPENFWLLAEAGDETLDYRHAVKRYADSRQTVLPGGEHGFSHWTDYLDEVIAYAGLA